MNQMKFLFSNELIIDSFAGGGGASTGIEWAFDRPVDIAINHNKEAIRMHEVNHPHTQHYCESVWDVDPLEATKGQPVALAWFSPDCTHFSKAKGGKPVKKEIRGLAWVVLRWAATARPRIICLENVEEFQTWGPISRKRGRDKHPRPCPWRKGNTFDRWVSQLEAIGYKVEFRLLSACDYGAPTSRKRLFMIARSDGEAIVWPEPSHGDPKSEAVKAKQLKPWRTAAECIDWSRPCPSIFLTREEARVINVRRPLAESTMRRIAKGVQRYVLDAKEPFIIQTGYGERPGQSPRVPDVHKPLGTVVACGVKHAVVSPHIIPIDNNGNKRSNPAHDINAPLRTITTENRHALVTAFLAQHNTGVVGHDVREPMSTILGRGSHQNVVTVSSHLMKLRGNSNERDSFQSIDTPAPTITAGGTHIAEVRAFLLKYYGTDQDPGITDPLHTITTKDRMGIVTVHGELWKLVDIGMRMFMPRELYRAQGFPDNYVIDPMINGKPLTKSAQVRMVGNSVSPYVACAIVAANAGAEEQMITQADVAIG